MVCTDASSVQPVLKTWLLRDLHRLWNTVRPMHRCFTGSTGAEDLALARLASSLEHRTSNAPMPFLGPSVQPVPIGRLGFDSLLHQSTMASVLPTTIGCSDAHGVGSSGATDRRATPCYHRMRNPRRGGPSGLAMLIFSFSLSSLEPKSLRMVILTIMLVQVLCCHLITKITRNGINGAMFVSSCKLEKHVRILS